MHACVRACISCVCVCIHTSRSTTDIQGRSQNLRHFYPGMGLKLGVFGFPQTQNNRGSSGTCHLHLLWSVSVKINMRKTPHGTLRSWTLHCLLFLSQFEPMADDAIIWGGIRGLGSPFVQCISVRSTLCLLTWAMLIDEHGCTPPSYF